MKPILTFLGVLFSLAGGVWFLQGIGLLPGSIMSGQGQWAVYGGLMILLGVGMVILARRRSGK